MNAIASGEERWYSGTDALAAAAEGFGDATGYTAAFQGINNRDPYTGADLNLGTGQRIFLGAAGFLSMAGLGLAGIGSLASYTPALMGYANGVTSEIQGGIRVLWGPPPASGALAGGARLAWLEILPRVPRSVAGSALEHSLDS